MLKRDSLTAQMQQLSHALAKVKRLVLEGKVIDATASVEESLTSYYGTSITYLLETPANVFVRDLREQNFVSEEITLLAGFLDELAELQEGAEPAKLLWLKVIDLYDLLENEYKVVSFEHLARRSVILSDL